MFLRFAVVLSLIFFLHGQGSEPGSLTYLSSCAQSNKEGSLDNVNYERNKIYIYIDSSESNEFAINIKPHNSNDIALRLKGDCNKRLIKASKMIRGKKWVILGEVEIPSASPVCNGHQFLVFVNIKRKEVMVEDIKINLKQPLKNIQTSQQGHVGRVEVMKGRGLLIATGSNCIAFPPSITGCRGAATWYNEHQTCNNGKNGFLSCSDGPTCDKDGNFEVVQRMGSIAFTCVNSSGRFLSAPVSINHVEGNNANKYCEEISQKMKV